MMYFKQYGAQRTGTNYLKRLMEINFEQVTVFGSVLGWKHGMYETGNGYQHKCHSHEQWIKDKTREDGRVYSVDNYPLKHTPEQLHEACGNLHYLISCKDPYAFVVSYKRFRANKQPWNEDKVTRWIHTYLQQNARWRRLYDRAPDKCIMVDYEQLICNRDVVLSTIKSKFGLTQKHEQFRNEHRVVGASTDHGLIIKKSDFDTKYYTDKQYMQEIPDNIRRTITAALHNISSDMR